MDFAHRDTSTPATLDALTLSQLTLVSETGQLRLGSSVGAPASYLHKGNMAPHEAQRGDTHRHRSKTRASQQGQHQQQTPAAPPLEIAHGWIFPDPPGAPPLRGRSLDVSGEPKTRRFRVPTGGGFLFKEETLRLPFPPATLCPASFTPVHFEASFKVFVHLSPIPTLCPLIQRMADRHPVFFHHKRSPEVPWDLRHIGKELLRTAFFSSKTHNFVSLHHTCIRTHGQVERGWDCRTRLPVLCQLSKALLLSATVNCFRASVMFFLLPSSKLFTTIHNVLHPVCDELHPANRIVTLSAWCRVCRKRQPGLAPCLRPAE